MIRSLKILVEQIYGMPIKYGNQCKNLSSFIFDQTGEYLSYQTLRRFFNFIDNNKQPSNRTLDILARLCGYNHYDDFTSNYKAKKEINVIESIYNIPIRRELDLNYHLVCRNIAESLYKDLNLLNRNSLFLAKSKVAQEFFFERFPFIDHLHNPIYRRALNSYLKNKNSIDAKVFVESMLFLADYLKTGKIRRASITYKLENIESLHPFLQARIVGTFLIMSTHSKSGYVDLAFKLANQNKEVSSASMLFPFFNYMMADYLIICGFYKEAVNIIEMANTNKDSTPTNWLETGYYETLDLLYAIALEGCQKNEKAMRVFKKINTDRFHFIFRNYFLIQYLKLKFRLEGRLSIQDRKALTRLHADTKFYML